MRFNLWARATVTFLRGRLEWADDVDFLFAAVLGLWAPAVFGAVLDFGALAVEGVFFFVVGEALSCADSGPPGESNRMTRREATKRLERLTLFSVARFGSRPAGSWFTESVPACDMAALRSSLLAFRSSLFARKSPRRFRVAAITGLKRMVS